MISSVTSTADATAANAAMKSSLGLSSDDFLKLFVAQLQNQDPLAPQDPAAMLTQLSQMTMVEQANNTNTALNNLLTAQNNSTSINSVSFIGKTVTANGNAAVFDGSSPTSLQYNLPAAASSGTVTITDAAGNTIRTAALGAQASGNSSFSWDGRDNSGALVPAGAYSFAVNATSTNGTAIAATTYTTGRVDGINVASGTPVLTIGAATVSLSNVISISGV
ncbi:MAG: flagellar hook assembly protein FlgD [Geobacteraceae bacterium]|nr:flagellar hook assembly protein FlgD [Geobacteraceae bacterium]